MSDQFFVTDTHPLIWYLSKQDAKLPKKVLAAFNGAREGNGTYIWVPAAVVWELSQLMRKTARITALGSFEELVGESFYCKSMAITQIGPDDLIIAHGLSFNRDPFDALVVATALRMELPLLTADAEITNAGICEVFWK